MTNFEAAAAHLHEAAGSIERAIAALPLDFTAKGELLVALNRVQVTASGIMRGIDASGDDLLTPSEIAASAR